MTNFCRYPQDIEALTDFPTDIKRRFTTWAMATSNTSKNLLHPAPYVYYLYAYTSDTFVIWYHITFTTSFVHCFHFVSFCIPFVLLFHLRSWHVAIIVYHRWSFEPTSFLRWSQSWLTIGSIILLGELNFGELPQQPNKPPFRVSWVFFWRCQKSFRNHIKITCPSTTPVITFVSWNKICQGS